MILKESFICCNTFSNLHSFPNGGTLNVRFNGSGSRLLCFERGPSQFDQLVVYDLPTFHQSTVIGKMQLIDPGFRNKDVGSDACCFASLEDDLVIGGSEDHNLFIWSLPDGNRNIDCTVNRSLRVLPGHGETIRSIRCSSDNSAIVTSAVDGVIKLWTAWR